MEYDKIMDSYDKSQRRLIHALVDKTRECYLYEVKIRLYETFLTKDQIRSVEKFVEELSKHIKRDNK